MTGIIQCLGYARLFLLAAFLWLTFIPSAFALRAPSLSSTVLSENRVGGSDPFASGRLDIEDVQSPENTMSLEGCGYETASGRRKWLNRDPIGEAGGINLYQFVYNDPLNYVDPDGEAVFAAVLPFAGGLSLVDGPLPIGDALAGVLLAGAAIWDHYHPETPILGGDIPINGPFICPVKKVEPVKGAGPHTGFKKDPSGKISGYTEFDAHGNPVKRFRGDGKPHGGQQPPFILEPRAGKGPGSPPVVPRPPKPSEKPPGY